MLELRTYLKSIGEPIVIREGDRPLFGLHHSPSGAVQRSAGVVLCNSIGYESLCAYRSYREAADQLAAAGFHVLRFDYYGMGDSGGNPDDARACVDDIAAAIDTLKQRAQVAEVCLFGVRAGALLAVAAASKRADVTSLAVWGTPASGRAYVRELRAFQAMSGEPASEGQGLRVAGFSIAAQVAEELTAIDAAALSPERPLQVLVLRRDDIAGEERIAQRWSERGHQVGVSAVPGYAAMMSTAESSVVPHVGLTRLREWAESIYPNIVPQSPEAAPSATPARLLCADQSVVEEGVRFGPSSQLFGVLSEPSASVASEPRRAVIILNTGANHHIGAGRFSVTLARALASAGNAVLRLDLEGLGESRAKEGFENQLYTSTASNSAAHALRFLRDARHIDEFVFVGVCAGAYAGLRTALTEPRVVAQVLVNLAIFEPSVAQAYVNTQTSSFKSRSAYVRTALDPRTWKRLVQGDIALVPVARHLLGQTAKAVVFRVQKRFQQLTRSDAVANDVEAGFRMMSRRQVRSLLVYSRNDPTLDTLAVYLGEEAETMRNDPNFKLTVIEDADHTFTWPKAPARLLAAVAGFVGSLPPPRPAQR